MTEMNKYIPSLLPVKGKQLPKMFNISSSKVSKVSLTFILSLAEVSITLMFCFFSKLFLISSFTCLLSVKSILFPAIINPILLTSTLFVILSIQFLIS